MRRRTWRIEWTYNMDSSNAAEALGFDGLGLSDEVLAAVRDLGYTEPTQHRNPSGSLVGLFVCRKIRNDDTASDSHQWHADYRRADF